MNNRALLRVALDGLAAAVLLIVQPLLAHHAHRSGRWFGMRAKDQGDRKLRRTVSGWWAFSLVVGLVLGGCASRVGSIGSQDSETLTLEAWCAAQPADRCVEALTLLHQLPEQEACVLAVTDPTKPLSEMCQLSSPEPIGEPVTTIPTPDQIAEMEREQAAYEESRRVFIEEELPLLDARIAETLKRTHPTGELTVGLVFAEPLTVPDIEAITEELGGVWVSAWRTDYVCSPALAGQTQASRFAFRDGVERAAAARQAADQSQEPLVGRFIFEAAWAAMEHAAQAIREPGVLVEAVEVLLPVERLSILNGEPKVRTVRIAATPEEAGDLTNPPVPSCES